MKKNHGAISLICFTILLGWCTSLSAQNSNEPKQITTTYLLKNAHIITKPGQSTFGSVLIKDGLIVQVGHSITTPYDAQVVDVDSMYIYAGFIDPISHVGLKKEERKETPKVEDTGNPPNDIAGITPEHSVYLDFDPNEGSVKKMREAGYGIAHVVPNGRMLPGKGAIFSLGEGEASQLVIKKDASMFSQLKSAPRRMLPGTTIGVMAKYRDIYRNAEATVKYANKYDANPVGMRRAQIDPAIEAFIPVVNKQLPVYFIANSGLDVSRVITLQRELGFNLVIADVEQGWTMANKIKAGNYPILLSLDLPDEIKEKKNEDDEMSDEEKAEAEKKKQEEDAKLTRLEKINIEAKNNKEERKKLSVKEYESQASVMEKQGIKFSFTGISTKPNDVQKNLRRMIAAGLTEKTALAAITTNPASQLGISKIAGTVESGKIANLVVTDKPYFEDKSTIRYVFVDGQMSEMKKKDAKKGKVEAGAAENLIGEWKYTVEVPGQSQGGTMKVIQDTGELLLELDSNDSPGEFDEGTNVNLDDDKLTFDMSIENDGFTMELSFDLEVNGDTMTGSVSVGQFGTFPVEMTKTPK